MIIGACGEAGTPIYEARNKELTGWEYKGIMWDKSVECPNFIPLGDRWVFISSPFDRVSYNVGAFDIDTLRFTPETTGIVDWGHYYGTNTAFDAQGRCILFGWAPGWDWDAYRDGRGWNGCMSLPRILSLDANGRLLQSPAPELKQLRTRDTPFHRADMLLTDSSHVLEDAAGDTLEVIAEFLPGNAKSYGLKVRRSRDGQRSIAIRCDIEKNILDIAGVSAPLPRANGGAPLKLHVFLDKSVTEVYVNEGEIVATRMLYPEPEDLGVEVFALRGSVQVKSIDIWSMSPAVLISRDEYI
jgi:beta-fructofuranosidase